MARPEDGVRRLLGAELLAATTLGGPLRFDDLGAGDGGGADHADLACANEIGEDAEGLVDVDRLIDPVNLIEVDPVGPEALQRCFDRLRDPSPGGAAVIRISTERQTSLRRQDHIVALAPGERFADDRLRFTRRVKNQRCRRS